MSDNIYCPTLKYCCKSIKDAAELGGVTKNWLRTRLNKFGKAVTPDGIEFVVNISSKLKTSTYDKEIVCEQTGTHYKSIVDLALLLNKPPKDIVSGLNTFGKYISFDGKTYTYAKENTLQKAMQSKTKYNKKNKAIICKETGNRFESMSLLAKYVKCHPTWISFNFKNRGKFIDKDGHTYILENTIPEVTKFEFSPIPLSKLREEKEKIEAKTIKSTVTKTARGGYMRKSLICLETKERFNSIQALREKLHTGHGTINRRLALEGKYINNGKTYVYENAENKNNASQLSVPKKANGHSRKAISITCVQTGEVFKSAKFVAAKTKYSTGYIGQCLKQYGQFKVNGNTYVYTHNISPKTASDGTVIICKETGDRFESLDLFCKYVMANKETVLNIFKNNGKYTMKDGRAFILEKVKNIVPEQSVIEKVETPVQVEETTEKQEKLPIVQVIKKVNELRAKVYDEQAALQDTLISFVRKKMYKNALILCESMQKIYENKQ